MAANCCVPPTIICGDTGVIAIEFTTKPVPLKPICCTVPVPFRLLSVMLTVPVNGPKRSGENSTPRTQLSLEVSEVVLVQVVPDPFRLKLLLVWPVVPVANAVMFIGSLPMFSNVTVCGLSVLVWPTIVLAKLKANPVANSAARLL